MKFVYSLMIILEVNNMIVIKSCSKRCYGALLC